MNGSDPKPERLNTVFLEMTSLHCALSAADARNNQRAANAFGNNQNADTQVRGIAFELQWTAIKVLSATGQEGKVLIGAIGTGDIEGLSTWRPRGWNREELLFASDPNLALIVARSNLAGVEARLDVQHLSGMLAAWSARKDVLPEERNHLGSSSSEDHSSRQHSTTSTFVESDAGALTMDGAHSTKHPVNGVLQLPLAGSSDPSSQNEKQADQDPEVPPTSQSDHTATSAPELPPRVRFVLDLGKIAGTVIDHVSEQPTTLVFESEGLHFGVYTSYTDLIARRDLATRKEGFREEAGLEERREAAGDDVNIAMPPSMLKPTLRRRFQDPRASLQDNYSFSMRFDSEITILPLAVDIAPKGVDSLPSNDVKTLSIGSFHFVSAGDLLGRVIPFRGGREQVQLDWWSISSSANVGIDHGIKVNLWKAEVVDAISALLVAHRAVPIGEKDAEMKKSGLHRIPSGVAVRINTGLVSVFLGHEDPNPHCKLRLTRGLWIRTEASFEYAFYASRSQVLSWRHQRLSPERAKLRLPEDISMQARAWMNELDQFGGRAALVQLVLANTAVIPIYNGDRFEAAGGVWGDLPRNVPLVPKQSDEALGWYFRRQKELEKREQEKDDPHPKQMSNAEPPFEISDTAQARRPLFWMPRASTKWIIHNADQDQELQHQLTAKIDSISMVSDMSHIYCCLIAALTVERISNAGSRGIKKEPKPSSRPAFDALLSINSLTIHISFPLQEQLYMAISKIEVQAGHTKAPSTSLRSALAYVPSVRVPGAWEELIRIKQLSLGMDLDQDTPSFDTSAEAFRVQIPVAYQLARLVLNVSVSIKALKLLSEDLHRPTSEFSFVKRPAAEEPKNVPHLRFRIQTLSLEALDDPIESSLNLAFRVSPVELERRATLYETFEQKVALIGEADARMSSSDEDDSGYAAGLNPAHLTARRTVAFEEAERRLHEAISAEWMNRIRKAKEEALRREAQITKPMNLSSSPMEIPIAVVESTDNTPLFRALFQGVDMSFRKPKMNRDEIIQFMGDVSSPFAPDVEFSLMVPLQMSWKMDEAVVRLREYPLPLIRIPSVKMSGPAWEVDTLFIIAEELVHNGDDSIVFVPCDVIPGDCGAMGACPFTVQISKTLMPVKTYTKPTIKIHSERTTEFAWGNSYQPAVQDFIRVVETLSHPPRDPSERIGFWDKFRLILHWMPTFEFAGPVHLHLKGSWSPYAVEGFGAGFCLAWEGNTKLTINQPNQQYEAIQIAADQLDIAIPDLTSLRDGAAVGNHAREESHTKRNNEDGPLVERRYTKPCARFVNGVRVGFGFRFERTCRNHTCSNDCPFSPSPEGSHALLDRNQLLERPCRMFDFIPHQKVTLISNEAWERKAKELGRVSHHMLCG